MALTALRRIRANLSKNRNRETLREQLKPVFEEALATANERFRSILSRKSVSSFRNTVASGRARDSMETDINRVLRWRNDSLTFSLAFRSSPGNSKRSDPADYIAALDDASRRQGGPSKARVRQWLYDRGILKPGQTHIAMQTRDGTKQVNVKRFIFLVQRGIWRKTRQRTYKSLRIAEAMERSIDIQNPQSAFRKGALRRMTNIVLGAD